jgi:uncharacterized membrane protein YhaH (DUF805 family)
VTVFASVDAGQLLQVAWTSAAAGIGITTIFSLLVFSGARAGEARRAGDSSLAMAFAVLTTVALLVFVGAVVVGVTIMLQN